VSSNRHRRRITVSTMQTGQQRMGPSMMQGGMGPGMMQGGMGPSMSAMFESRVTPMTKLSVEDVGLNVPDLQSLVVEAVELYGAIAAYGSITADIVTVDNSLVQRLKVDRHTGTIEYQN